MGFRPVVILAVAGALIAGGVLCLWPVDRSALSWMLGRCRVKWSNFIGEPAAHTACCLTLRLSDVLRTSRPPVTEVIERPSPSGHRGHRAPLPLRSQRSPGAPHPQVTEVTGRPSPPVTEVTSYISLTPNDEFTEHPSLATGVPLPAVVWRHPVKAASFPGSIDIDGGPGSRAGDRFIPHGHQ